MKANYNDLNRVDSTKAAIDIDLQMTLLNTWTKHQVADYYQNAFLVHLDELDRQSAEEKIRKEVKYTMLRRSYFYQLDNLEKERSNMLLQMQEHLSKGHKEAGQQHLAVACQMVKEVRDLNLQSAETIMRMGQDFRCRNEDAKARQLEEYSPLIDNLQKSVKFIKESYLSEYLTFGEGFDPFFMNNYQQYHRENHQDDKAPIKQFYKISISHVYRLMKAKNAMLEMIAPSKHQRESRYRRRQSYKYEALPSLHTESIHENPRYEDQSYTNKHFPIPIKISPIKILHGRFERSSRTTIHPDRGDYRPDSSFTQEHFNSKFKSSKLFNSFEKNKSNPSRSNKIKKNKVYLLAQEADPRKSMPKKYFLHNNEDGLRGRSEDYVDRHINHNHNRHVFKPENAISQRQATDNSSNEISKLKAILQLKSNRQKNDQARYASPNLMVASVKNYNPIKKQSFEISMTPNISKKYDFNAQYRHHSHPLANLEPTQESRGINDEEPISKFNMKNKFIAKKQIAFVNQAPFIGGAKGIEKVDQEIQTTELKGALDLQKTTAKVIQNSTHLKSVERVPKDKRRSKQDDDQTIENEDIVDERPVKPKLEEKQPLIRVVNSPKKQPKPPSPIKTQSPTSKVVQDKKQVKMKIGKSTLKEVLSLLQSSTIQPQYNALFDMQKLVQWLRVGQTYLTEFHVNDACAIIALCSPIPNVGMALKLWAPISDSVNFALSSSLFAKYVEFIEKSTSVDKILFSGNGEAFKELANCDFQMKKDKLYERIRKFPPKKIQSQFQPFLYVECSTVNFPQNSKENLLFSQEIQEFKSNNCHLAKFLGVIKPSSIPQPLQPLIKVSEKISNFGQVNKILEKEELDQYQANDVKVSNITLLRLYFNSALKSSFITNEGYIRLIGSLLHEKERECLIAVSTTKNNGTMYFSKNMSFQSIIEKSKTNSSNKVVFSVKMFTKKLYGKLVGFPSGCYGNCQINLTWQDQMQGKIKHNLVGERCFGSEVFTIGVELQKTMLYCITIDKDDYIY